MRIAATVLPGVLLLGVAFASVDACSSAGGDASDLPPIDDGGGDGVVVDMGDEGGAGCTGAQVACGAVCVDVASDNANCGSCGNACGAGGACCNSKCVVTKSCALAVTNIDPAGGWQNGGDWIKLHGNGFVKGMKVFIADGRAPVRVIDATTAILQTPPGKIGKQDVKIVVGSATATLPKSFAYTDAGLGTPWQQKPMAKVRGEDPAIAVLQDGRVLVAGGTTVPDSAADALATAEIYTRSTDKVVPTANDMSVPRWHDSAITLLTGKVLVVGAANGGSPDADKADLFDPATNKFAPTSAPMTMARNYMRSILMVDGRVLIASANDASLEIYDPETDKFTAVPATQRHVFGFMVRLRDGRVLIGAGDGGVTAAETFDADTNTLTSVGSLTAGRSMLTAHTLPDGRVIVIAGASLSAGGIHVPLDSIEYFDPATNKFTAAPYKLSIGRTWHASALVRDGTILVMGGYTGDAKCDSLTDSVDQIDPVKGTVITFPKLPNANTEWTAVTLLDGSVLGVGGGACGTATALPDLDFLPGAGGPT